MTTSLNINFYFSNYFGLLLESQKDKSISSFTLIVFSKEIVMLFVNE